MANLANIVSKAIKIVAKVVPGAVVTCSWSPITETEYDPEEGVYIEKTPVTCLFTAIKSEYSHSQFQSNRYGGPLGIEAGDFPLLVNQDALPSRPPIGSVISFNDKDHEVVNITETADLLYSMQMRDK
jgi:hypothetical protein